MKINIKDLTPNAEEIIVTHKIGDISVRQYIKQENIFDQVVDMIIDGFNEEAIRDTLEDGIFDYLGQPDASDVKWDMYPTWSREIMALIYDDAQDEADDRNKRAEEWEKEKRDSYNELVGGNR